jgi:hypothetical protein
VFLFALFLPAALDALFLAVFFFAPARFALPFFAETFFAVPFLAPAFLALLRLAAPFFAVLMLGAAFFATATGALAPSFAAFFATAG